MNFAMLLFNSVRIWALSWKFKIFVFIDGLKFRYWGPVKIIFGEFEIFEIFWIGIILWVMTLIWMILLTLV